MRLVDLIMFFILTAIALVILNRLWWARDGDEKFRIVMLMFFTAELLTDIGWIAVLFSIGQTMKDVTLQNIFFLYLPKLVAKLLFYRFVRRNFK